MDQELQQKLFNKYPKIFIQKYLPPQKTGMCWGIECGNGWYKLIDNLCDVIQFNIDKNGYQQIETTQVKEKFGGLRFYITTNGEYILGQHEYIMGMIDFAEHLSSQICENCGSMENVSQTKGWIKTICKKCLEKNKNESN